LTLKLTSVIPTASKLKKICSHHQFVTRLFHKHSWTVCQTTMKFYPLTFADWLMQMSKKLIWKMIMYEQVKSCCSILIQCHIDNSLICIFLQRKLLQEWESFFLSNFQILLSSCSQILEIVLNATTGVEQSVNFLFLWMIASLPFQHNEFGQKNCWPNREPCPIKNFSHIFFYW